MRVSIAKRRLVKTIEVLIEGGLNDVKADFVWRHAKQSGESFHAVSLAYVAGALKTMNADIPDLHTHRLHNAVAELAHQLVAPLLLGTNKLPPVHPRLRKSAGKLRTSLNAYGRRIASFVPAEDERP